MLLRKGLKKKKLNAAIKIQTYYRGYKGKMFYKQILEKRETAIIKIQN